MPGAGASSLNAALSNSSEENGEKTCEAAPTTLSKASAARIPHDDCAASTGGMESEQETSSAAVAASGIDDCEKEPTQASDWERHRNARKSVLPEACLVLGFCL